MLISSSRATGGEQRCWRWIASLDASSHGSQGLLRQESQEETAEQGEMHSSRRKRKRAWMLQKSNIQSQCEKMSFLYGLARCKSLCGKSTDSIPKREKPTRGREGVTQRDKLAEQLTLLFRCQLPRVMGGLLVRSGRRKNILSKARQHQGPSTWQEQWGLLH